MQVYGGDSFFWCGGCVGSYYEIDSLPCLFLFMGRSDWSLYDCMVPDMHACMHSFIYSFIPLLLLLYLLQLLIEEKQIPIKISLVPMRSYGDKPREFLQKVPSGLLPAMEVNGQIITESQVIMELLDQWHAPEDGYRAMLPEKNDQEGRAKFDQLARLERELFGAWCNLIFRSEGPRLGAGNPLSRLLGGGGGGGGDSSAMSGSMQGFMDCVKKVDAALLSTKGPWFFDTHDYPTMIDMVFVSHVERMLASCAYWKGLDMRDAKWNLKGLNAWLDAFEKREAYLAYKSDYLTHVKVCTSISGSCCILYIAAHGLELERRLNFSTTYLLTCLVGIFVHFFKCVTGYSSPIRPRKRRRFRRRSSKIFQFDPW
jgi:glutathione S-transferase